MLGIEYILFRYATTNLLMYLSWQVTRLGMFEVHCDELIRGLAKRADGICNKLLSRMSKDHQEANKAYVILLILFRSL